VDYFKLLSQYLPGRRITTKKSVQPVSEQKFEPDTSRLGSRTVEGNVMNDDYCLFNDSF
jgi:hypothetical protein